MVRRRELEADLQQSSGNVVAALAETRDQIARLAQLTAELAGLAGQGQPVSAAQADKLASEARALAERAGQGAAGERLATVFVQYGRSVAPEIAQALAEDLKGQGYVVPTEDRMPNDAREVRYFHAEDRDAANELATRTTTALASLGFPGLVVEVRDFTAWAKAKPRAGTLELWLALPEARSG